jgi:hypothetical protein
VDKVIPGHFDTSLRLFAERASLPRIRLVIQIVGEQVRFIVFTIMRVNRIPTCFQVS